LALATYQAVFSGKTVPPNILLRDYAQNVMEVAHHKGGLPEGIDPDSLRPPFRSRFPKIISDKEMIDIVKNEGWRWIKYSTTPNEGMGGYGDFGRYVMEGKVHRFSDVPLKKSFP